MDLSGVPKGGATYSAEPIESLPSRNRIRLRDEDTVAPRLSAADIQFCCIDSGADGPKSDGSGIDTDYLRCCQRKVSMVGEQVFVADAVTGEVWCVRFGS